MQSCICKQCASCRMDEGVRKLRRRVSSVKEIAFLHKWINLNKCISFFYYYDHFFKFKFIYPLQCTPGSIYMCILAPERVLKTVCV